MAILTLQEFLTKLASTEGAVSVHQGIVTLEDGDSIDLSPLTQEAYVLIQEGGSSDELYLHAHTSMAEAEADRQSCAQGAYRTTPAIAVNGMLAAMGEPFYEAIEAVLSSRDDLDYPEEPAEDATQPTIPEELEGTQHRGKLQDEYDIYVSNAKSLGWNIKSFDEWLNS